MGEGVGESLFCSGYDTPRVCYNQTYDWEPQRLLWDKQLITFSGKLTENCVQLISKDSANWVYEPKRTEYETAILKRF